MTAWDWGPQSRPRGSHLGFLECLAVPQPFEASSLLAYTSLFQTVLDVDARLTFSEQFRIDVTGLGASHLLPGVEPAPRRFAIG